MQITRAYCMHSKLRFCVKLLLVLLFFPHVTLHQPEQCCREGEGYDVTQVAGGENELNREADAAVEVVSDRDLRVIPIPKRPQKYDCISYKRPSVLMRQLT